GADRIATRHQLRRGRRERDLPRRPRSGSVSVGMDRAQPTLGLRNMNMESLYEYGSRAGFWRLYRAFTARDLPVTVYGVAMALERNPPAVAAMLAADWEIATHGYRWIDYQFVSEAVEREYIAKVLG